VQPDVDALLAGHDGASIAVVAGAAIASSRVIPAFSCGALTFVTARSPSWCRMRHAWRRYSVAAPCRLGATFQDGSVPDMRARPSADRKLA
jgi:hypothetical protein